MTEMKFYLQGDLIWFDPGVGYSLPGEVVEFSKPAGVIIVQVSIDAPSLSCDKLFFPSSSMCMSSLKINRAKL